MSVEKLDKLSPIDETNKSTAKREAPVENGKDSNNLQPEEQTDSPKVNKAVSSTTNDSEDEENDNSNEKDENLNKVTKVQYNLSAVVCYIDDKSNDDQRHVVALVRVSPEYHERSTGSAVAQWYIFNDFRYEIH